MRCCVGECNEPQDSLAGPKDRGCFTASWSLSPPAMTTLGDRIPNSPQSDCISKVTQVSLSLGFRSEEMYWNAFWRFRALALSVSSFASRRTVHSSIALKLTSTALSEIESVHRRNAVKSGDSTRASAKPGFPPRILMIRCESRLKFQNWASPNTVSSYSPPSFKPLTLAVTSRTKLLLTSSYLFKAQTCYPASQ